VIRLRPVVEDDLAMFRRFAVEPGLIGLDWAGFRERAQAMLCDYLFTHTPVQRIQAGTHPENVAEQKSLEKAGFRLEGVIRACEFRAGQWRDGWLYSRLRDDHRAVREGR
jgi:RimJ/RimL family protein N-acetyltransferase